MLSDPRHMGRSEPGYRQVWTWHALEETEHKAVAYDVWNVPKPGPYRYLLRAFTMLTTVTFWALVFVFHVRLVMADKTCRCSGFGRVVNFLWGRRACCAR